MQQISRAIPISLSILAIASLSSLLPMPVQADCGSPVPSAPQVWAKSGPGVGQITLNWSQAAYANRYAVEYGTTPNNYQYGSTNIGGKDSTQYTVGALKPGQTYYFRLAAARDCSSSPFSYEINAASGGAVPDSQMSMPLANTSPSPDMTPPQDQTTPMPEVMQNQQTMMNQPTTESVVMSTKPVGKQMLWASKGPKIGEVTLHWSDADSANNYHVVYGNGSSTSQYGALNIGNTHWYTVSHLNPGSSYSFALVPLLNGRSLETTSSVTITAMSSAIQLPTNVQGIETQIPEVNGTPAEITDPVPSVEPVKQSGITPEQKEAIRKAVTKFVDKMGITDNQQTQPEDITPQEDQVTPEVQSTDDQIQPDENQQIQEFDQNSGQ